MASVNIFDRPDYVPLHRRLPVDVLPLPKEIQYSVHLIEQVEALAYLCDGWLTVSNMQWHEVTASYVLIKRWLKALGHDPQLPFQKGFGPAVTLVRGLPPA